MSGGRNKMTNDKSIWLTKSQRIKRNNEITRKMLIENPERRKQYNKKQMDRYRYIRDTLRQHDKSHHVSDTYGCGVYYD